MYIAYCAVNECIGKRKKITSQNYVGDAVRENSEHQDKDIVTDAYGRGTVSKRLHELAVI